MKRSNLCFMLLFSLLTGLHVQGQAPSAQAINPLQKGIRYDFTDDGKYNVKFGLGTQLWVRYAQENPNTYNLMGEPVEHSLDFLIRRSTVKIETSLDRLYLFTMFGVQSETQNESYGPFSKNGANFIFYDLYASYSFFNRKLYVGYGLHLYHGLSRYSSASGVSLLGADIPRLGGPNAIITQQIGRQLGFFADGLAGSLGYRFVLASPFTTDSEYRPPVSTNKAADIPNTQLKTEGYVNWQFFDKEIKPVAFTTGTYIGKKKVLNVGTGFEYHPQSTASLNDLGDTVKHDQLHFAVDVYADLPLGKGSALTLYGAYFLYDFGPNYYRTGAFGNTFRATSPAGAGIAEPEAGSGSAIATQVGWLLPVKIKEQNKIQVYYEGDYRFFDALDDAALHHNIGASYFVLDYNFRFTLQHEFRPYFTGATMDSYKNMTILKLQIVI